MCISNTVGLLHPAQHFCEAKRLSIKQCAKAGSGEHLHLPAAGKPCNSAHSLVPSLSVFVRAVSMQNLDACGAAAAAACDHSCCRRGKLCVADVLSFWRCQHGKASGCCHVGQRRIMLHCVCTACLYARVILYKELQRLHANASRTAMRPARLACGGVAAAGASGCRVTLTQHWVFSRLVLRMCDWSAERGCSGVSIGRSRRVEHYLIGICGLCRV